jgi:hypothetical protein
MVKKKTVQSSLYEIKDKHFMKDIFKRQAKRKDLNDIHSTIIYCNNVIKTYSGCQHFSMLVNDNARHAFCVWLENLK